MPSTHTLDHVVIAVQNLDQAIQDYHELGFTVVRGGLHANGATQNALICFADGMYLELLAPTGAAPAPGLIDFSVLLEHGEGFVGYALGSADVEADVARLQAEGREAGPVVPGERLRSDGTLIRWILAQIDRGFAPFLIQDLTPRTLRVPDAPEVTTHANGASGLRGIRVRVGSRLLATASARHAKLTGVEPRPSYGYQEITLKSGRIVLEEAPNEPGSARVLYAVEIFGEDVPSDLMDKTHGVRFVRYPRS